MADTRRITEEFKRIASFDSESFEEREIAEYLKQKLSDLGFTVSEDDTKNKFITKHPMAASNIYGILKGNEEGTPRLFCAHLDTVKPGKSKRVVVHEDGRITGIGDTVLGADDISGLVSILEALTIIKENNLPHPDIEVLFTVAEEPYCEGSRYADFRRLKSKQGYVLDLVGPVGTAATAAPSIISLEIQISGKAAHAGFNPEDGINALNIAVAALSQISTGHVDDITTVNFGTINGGTGKNIVPEQVVITGEIRSLEHERALSLAEKIKKIFTREAASLGGDAKVNINPHIRAYSVSSASPVIKRFDRAVKALGIPSEVRGRCRVPESITTFGGSDANRLNQNGIETIVIACAMENVHSTEEYTTLSELEYSADLTLKLMTLID